MDVYKLLINHRSIRRYRPDPVPEGVIERVLGAAIRASSSGNMQAFSVIVTSDPALRRELHPLHFGQDMVLEAPHFVTFCSDFHRMRRWLALRDAEDGFDNLMSFMIGAIDAVLVAQSAIMAAESEGLGACFLGTTLANCEAIAKVLKLPDNVVPVVGFTLGYPAESPGVRDRLPLGGLLHRETYRDPSDEELLETYRRRETAGWERYMAAPGLRDRVLEAGARNLAQVYTTVKYTRESHIVYSRTIARCLERKRFLEWGPSAPARTPRDTDGGLGPA